MLLPAALFVSLQFLANTAYGQSSSSSSASSTTTSSAATASASASASTIKSKRGIAYPRDNNAEDVKNFNQTDSLIGWAYDWSDEPTQSLSQSGIEFVPIQWGSTGVQDFAANVKKQNAKTILGFNEPDFAEQSNIQPAEAANLWKRYIEPLKDDGVRLGSPAITSDVTGQPWMQNFMKDCSDCTIDFIVVHWYGEGVGGFYDFIYQVHGQWPDKKIWVTEFGDTSLDANTVMTFMEEILNFLDTTDWIERYCWFGFFRPSPKYAYNFLDIEGGLTNLGKAYIGADTVVRTGSAAGQSDNNNGPDGALSLNAGGIGLLLSAVCALLLNV